MKLFLFWTFFPLYIKKNLKKNYFKQTKKLNNLKNLSKKKMGNKNIKRVKTEGFPLNDDKEQLNTIEIYNKLSIEEKEKKEEDKNIKIVKKHNKESEDNTFG